MNKYETHKTIHVVEDEHAIRTILLQILSGCGFRVRTFMSGESYLAYMQRDGFGTPTVLLSDINMPGMNGLQLLREVQQQHPDLCCMLMTGNPDQCAERHLRQYGLAGRVRHVFTKPFRPLHLKNVLENA